MSEIEQVDAFSFEKLDVWQRAVSFAGAIYKVTKRFPREEQFGLTSQLRRAAVSIAANIAEGVSRSSGKEQARYVEIAFGSLNEVATMLYIAVGQEFMTHDQLACLKIETRDIGRMLSGLRRAALSVHR
jgi:four helix bundle protein